MAFLKIISGDLKGTKVQIDRDEVVIGRAPENVVPIDDASVSGRHCMIRRDGRRFTLTDLKSTNGTLLNDVPIESYRLSAKDVITVGSVRILFDGDDIEDAHPTQIPPTIVRPASKNAQSGKAAERPGRPAAFEKRKSGKGLWIAISAIFGVLGLAALVWFVMQMFGGK
jgi:pSer/pThr/pTyr-binding forkhead associated (FHA) protein